MVNKYMINIHENVFHVKNDNHKCSKPNSHHIIEPYMQKILLL